MENPIKQIYRFNKEAGLLEQPYNDFLEASFQVEEALEDFPHLDELSMRLGIKDSTPKKLSRAIIGIANGLGLYPISDVKRLDKACDAVVFAVGSMAKLGLNPQQITKALNIVMQYNFTKLGMPKDEHGKLIKPEGFNGPEEALQKLLNER